MRSRNVLTALVAVGLVLVAVILLRWEAGDKLASPARTALQVPPSSTVAPASSWSSTTTTAFAPTTTRPVLPTTTPPTTAPRRQVDLQTAIDSGAVSYRATGGDLESVRISLTAHEPLDVEIPAGTFFAANGGGVQNMVVRGPKTITLRPEVEVDIDLEAACASMHLDTPYADDSFTVQGVHSAEMVALLGLPSFRNSAFRLQQFAIWTITDDPPSDGYVGLGAGGAYGAGPSTTELDRIRELFVAAGLDPGGYRALQ